jgi:hypothetical protein
MTQERRKRQRQNQAEGMGQLTGEGHRLEYFAKICGELTFALGG